ncbi:MAG: efflux RND transporter periplasmic adaptor subunit [Hyphomicrobium sp.]|nr:efflux RND transporter periplasmic adaptor subunit [Hyphomicrobium sp.]
MPLVSRKPSFLFAAIGAAVALTTSPAAAADMSTPAAPAIDAPAGELQTFTDANGQTYLAAPICRKSKGAVAGPDQTLMPQALAGSSPDGSMVSQGQGERRVKFYRNPMGLPDISPVPKKDEMGMDYIPVYEDGDGDAAAPGTAETFAIEPGKIQRTGVETALATRRQLAASIRAPGTVALDERRVFVIAPRFDAFVDSVSSTTSGTPVKTGDALMELYGEEMINQGTWLLVDVNASTGTPGSARPPTQITAARRLQDLGASEDFINTIRQERRVPRTMTVRAPKDGVILERTVMPGQRLKAGDAAFRMADLSVVWVIANVPESDIAGLKPGEAVEVRARAHPGHVFSGKVALIMPELNLETRTAKVRIEINNDGGMLLPGMYADVDISLPETADALAVPSASVIDTGDRQVVLVAQEGGRYGAHEVKVGRRSNGYVEILQGLADGDRIVTNGNFLIDAESNFQSAIKAFAPPRNTEARK